MKAFILSAGVGERLRSLTAQNPKVMLPIKGKPIIEHLILLCKRYGINDFIINLFWQPEKIVNYLGSGERLGVKIIYSFEPKLLGTGGAIKRMEKSLQGTFLVLYGDVMMDVDLSNQILYHKQKKGVGTMAIHDSLHPKDSDLVETDKNGQIIKFWGKPRKKEPATTLSAAGLLVLEPTIFDHIPKNKHCALEQIFPVLLKQGIPLFGYETNEYLKDIGTPDRYKEVKEDFEEKEN